MDKRQKYSEAMDIFNEWNDVVGIFRRNTSYYYEIEGVIEDIVENCFKAEIDESNLLEELKIARNKLLDGISEARTAQHKQSSNRLGDALDDLDSGYALLESVIKKLEKFSENKEEG